MSDAAKVTFVSTAYILGESRLKKNRGPIIDPWGTPQFKGLAVER